MVLYEFTVIAIAVISLLILRKFDKKVLRNFIIVFIGIILLQYFTQALWLTVGLAKWSYLYQGVNWIITIGRATMVIVSMTVIDLIFPRFSERARFGLYFIPILISGLIAETFSSARGTIQYHPQLLEAFSGIKILGSVPIEAIYYIPVFMLLVVSFARYWQIILDSNVTNKKSFITKKKGGLK